MRSISETERIANGLWDFFFTLFVYIQRTLSRLAGISMFESLKQQLSGIITEVCLLL